MIDSDLFSRWQSHTGYDPFFRDGVLSNEAWSTATPKVLFLLKESYGDWHGIEGPINIYNGKNRKFWWNIVRWKYLINHLVNHNEIADFPKKEDLPEVSMKDGFLDDIAYVNVKKSIGTSKSNNNEIQNYARKDKAFLAEQIDAINPDIILCGSTFWSYHVVYDGNNTMQQVSDRVHVHGDRVVLDYYHPGYFSAKGGELGLYNMLASIVSTLPAKEHLLKLKAD